MLRFLTITITLILLQACAGKKLIVNNADNLLEYQINKSLPLYSAQKKQLAKDVSTFLNQNKSKAEDLLPIVDALGTASEEKVIVQYETLATFYDSIALNFSQLLSRHLVTLNSKQQKEFFDRMEGQNREISKKSSKKRMEIIRDRFIMFFGSINELQKQGISLLESYFEDRHMARIQRRKELHQEFKLIFGRDVSSSARENLFFEAFKKYQEKAADHKKNIEIIKSLLPTLSGEQKKYFRKRLIEVKEILKLYIEADY